MTIQPIKEAIPIQLDEFGRYRVGKTNILLDLVIIAYQQGNTPETIIDSYPNLSLDDVYFAIGYYIRHRAKLDEYLIQQQTIAKAGEREDKERFPNQISREILLKRLKNRQSNK